MESTLTGIEIIEVSEFDQGPFMLIIPADLGVSSATELDGATIAVRTGTLSETVLQDFFRQEGMSYEPVPIETSEEAIAQFQGGAADVLVYPAGAISAEALPDDYIALPETLSAGTGTPPVDETPPNNEGPGETPDQPVETPVESDTPTVAGGATTVWVVSYFDDLNSRDLLGFKIRTPDSDTVNQGFEAEGIAPIPMATPEIFTALQTGVIDAAASGSRSLISSIASIDDALQEYQFTLNANGILTRVTADSATGTSDADMLVGSAVADNLAGLDGDDFLEGGGGNDTLDGGEGTDTAFFEGAQANYTVSIGPDGVTVMDRRADGMGTDQLSGIELLDFGTEIAVFQDGPLDLTKFGNAAALDSADFEAFVELYIAYFNRAPDAIGLNFWGSALKNGTSLEDIATLFFDQDETRALYPDLTDFEAFAMQVYENVLGRTFDQAGLDFWVGVLQEGSVSLSTFMLEIIRGAKSEPQPGDSAELTAQKLADVAYLSSKSDIGTYFAVINGLSDVADARTIMDLYDGSQSSVDSAVSAIDALSASAQAAETGTFLMPLVGVVSDPFDMT